MTETYESANSLLTELLKTSCSPLRIGFVGSNYRQVWDHLKQRFEPRRVDVDCVNIRYAIHDIYGMACNASTDHFRGRKWDVLIACIEGMSEGAISGIRLLAPPVEAGK